MTFKVPVMTRRTWWSLSYPPGSFPAKYRQTANALERQTQPPAVLLNCHADSQNIRLPFMSQPLPRPPSKLPLILKNSHESCPQRDIWLPWTMLITPFLVLLLYRLHLYLWNNTSLQFFTTAPLWDCGSFKTTLYLSVYPLYLSHRRLNY